MTGQQRFLDRCAQDLALLASGQETGWWDETGRPAPWPEGFWLVDDTINVHWHPTDHRKEEQPTDDHPFCLPHQPRRITKRLHHSTGLDRDRRQSPDDQWLQRG